MENYCCANCAFGLLSQNRYVAKVARPKVEPEQCWHCTFNNPTYPSGHPITEENAACVFYTTREENPRQPLRHLAATGLR